MEYPDELEADMAETYGVDVAGIGTDVRPLHAAVLASQLPPTSRTVRRIAPSAEWSVGEHMLATVIDQLSYLRYEEAVRAGARGVKKPAPVQRPGSRRQVARRATHVSKRRLDELLFGPRK